jgi:hypothetical protein
MSEAKPVKTADSTQALVSRMACWRRKKPDVWLNTYVSTRTVSSATIATATPARPPGGGKT